MKAGSALRSDLSVDIDGLATDTDNPRMGIFPQKGIFPRTGIFPVQTPGRPGSPPYHRE